MLDAQEQRVLGSLLEKQVTVPASYPLTLNSLKLACNQTSSREPVVDYSDNEINECLRGLKARELVRMIWMSGSRAVKYAQALDQQIELSDAERALITVLLLRGAQAPGALRTRTERLHPFADRTAVEATLGEMAERGLVRELPLRPREQDRRWIHLLGPVDTGTKPIAAPVDREAALANGIAARDAAILQTYDAVAQSYSDKFSAELDHRPFDRWLLTRLAEGASGPVADVGTGPGQIAAYLAGQGAEVIGSDISPAMVSEAARRYPHIRFEVEDFRRFLRPRTAAGWSLITAWYALVHYTESELPTLLRSLGSTLTSDGTLAFATHVGPETRHISEFEGHEVDIDLVLHDPEVVRAAVKAAGLTITEWYLTSPPPGDVETDRLYVIATKQG